MGLGCTFFEGWVDYQVGGGGGGIILYTCLAKQILMYRMNVQ